MTETIILFIFSNALAVALGLIVGHDLTARKGRAEVLPPRSDPIAMIDDHRDAEWDREYAECVEGQREAKNASLYEAEAAAHAHVNEWHRANSWWKKQ